MFSNPWLYCPSKKHNDRRDQRRLEKRDADLLLLAAPDANIEVDPNPIDNKPHGESDHYTLKFAPDLLATDDFDEGPEREVFAKSALTYLESLYTAMHSHFRISA